MCKKVLFNFLILFFSPKSWSSYNMYQNLTGLLRQLCANKLNCEVRLLISADLQAETNGKIFNSGLN